MRRLLIVFAILLALAVMAAAVGIFLSGSPRAGGGPQILVWRIDTPLVDYSEGPDLSSLRRHSPRSLAGLHQALVQARMDDNIRGLAVYLQTAGFGFGKAQELRSLLRSFRSADKSVECYLETAGEGSNGTLAYYLATACSRITLSPLGDWNVVGLYADSPFIRGTLDKLKIDPQFLHVGDYKSAAELYTETEHTPAAEKALGAVLDDLYDQIVTGIADSRDLSTELIRDLVDLAPLGAEEALASGLIDEITYPDVFETRISDGDKLALIPIEEYRVGPREFSKQRVAVVFAQGTIVRGGNGTNPWSQQRYIGAESLRQILHPLADDGNLAGVVLRVDSPGGSAVASDLILREVELLAASKPLVVSMSDVAASGGYYISAKAAKIVAEPGTITGSIGVVGGKLATRRFQAELLGITHDTLKRGENADFYSALDPFNPEQEARFLAAMTRVYDVFVGHVAAGRDMSRADVEEVAGGRIWTGRQALENGLIDEIGGLDRAIELVLDNAGLDPDSAVELDFYPRPPSLLELLSRSLSPFLDGRGVNFPPMPTFRVPHNLELPEDLVDLLLQQ
jgi:protease-4